MPRLLTVAVVALALMLAAQLHAQTALRDIPDSPPWMPEPPKPPKIPIQPPIREPPIRPPIRVPVVELMGYIYAQEVGPIPLDWRRPGRYPGPVEYYFASVDGQFYRLELGGAQFYLCGHFTSYVGTGRLVVVKGYLRPDFVWPLIDYGVLLATEVRDPAYPYCR